MARRTGPGRRRLAWVQLLPLLSLALALGWAWVQRRPADAPPAVASVPPAPGFVGNDVCADCHRGQADAWRQSHHARAMQVASADAVLGDFADARVEQAGRSTAFSRAGDRFLVRTDGADGNPASFEVRYVIGFEPLQQYLVEFPDGRLQVLPYAWDARPASAGGQRWYSLYPDDSPSPGDRLHWTGPYQNWNWMCADCHTTNLDRNYDAGADRFATRWSEFNVGCESCHGPGSAHVWWARQGGGDASRGLLQALDERDGVTWSTPPGASLPVRSKPPGPRAELAACAQCHSRRIPLDAGMDHDGRFLQTHEIALLDGGRYFHDGQQREEVYEVGSFLQSRMHAAGVTCSDCHEPHSGRLRAPGDAVCSQCHAPAQLASPAHALHAPGTPGAACVDCHMPARAYMGIDLRRDHSLRIPRPVDSAQVGAPDACTGCHVDRDARWAQSMLRAAATDEAPSMVLAARAFHAADRADPDAGSALARVAADPALPAITRATALALIRDYLGPGNVQVVAQALADPDAMVRGAAVGALQGAPERIRRDAILPLAADPSRPVRIRVAESLAGIDPAVLEPAQRAPLEAAFADYEWSRRANGDRAESRVELAGFLARQGDAGGAEREFRAAIRLQPAFLPAYLGLVDLLADTGRDAESGPVLDAAEAVLPGDAALVHARGLLRVREGRLAEAIPLLAQAAARAPTEPRYAYVLAVALHGQGRSRDAISTLEAALRRSPNDPALKAALDDYRRQADGAGLDRGRR